MRACCGEEECCRAPPTPQAACLPACLPPCLPPSLPPCLPPSLPPSQVCGVEEGGKDDFSPELVEALCAWLQEVGAGLTSLSLVDVALCGQARDGRRTMAILYHGYAY